MKTVFDNDMLAHVWAQGTQAHGKNANGTFRFDGGLLYSYAAKIAKRQANAQGVTCAVLIASQKWSVTTSAHQSIAARAVHGLGLPVFHVPNVDPRTDADHLANFNALIASRDKAADAATRARTERRKDWLRGQADGYDQHAQEYAKAFALGDPTKLAKRLARESAKAERERKQREAERAAAFEAAKVEVAPIVASIRDAWRAGGDVYQLFAASGLGPYSQQATALRTLFDSVTLLRVNGDNVETSRGAEFPVEHAKRAFRPLSVVVARGKPWDANGPDTALIRLGHFHVDRVEFVNGAAVVVAGCHRVAWSEVELCARALGLIVDTVNA